MPQRLLLQGKRVRGRSAAKRIVCHSRAGSFQAHPVARRGVRIRDGRTSCSASTSKLTYVGSMNRRAFLAASLFLACHRASTNARVPRIVSLSPSTTEALFAIGAGPLVVGRSRFCTYPQEATVLPTVGGYSDPSFEVILTLAPTLVVGTRGPGGRAISDRLQARGIATYFPETESIKAIEGMLFELGNRTGHSTEAAGRVDAIETKLLALQNRLEKVPRVRVLLLFEFEPIVSAAPDTFAHEMLERAHCTNVLTQGTGYPTLGLEQLHVLDPDAIVNATFREGGKVRAIDVHHEGWASLRAIRNRRIYNLTDDTVLRPGPRVAEGAERLASTIFGEV